MQVVSPTGALRLPVAQVTVLLGPGGARQRVLALLDEATARSQCGRPASAVRLSARDVPPADRVRRVQETAAQRPPLVLVDRLTDGLATEQRRAVLAAIRSLAASGPAVLVEDRDPVAALAVADGALRVDDGGSLSFEDLQL